MTDTRTAGEQADEPAGEAAAREPAERFRDFPLFRGLDDDEITRFLANGKWLDLGAGEVFIDQGESGGSLYFISHGELEVFARDDKGGEHALAAINAPAVVGEVEFLTGEPRAASVRAKTPASGVALSTKRLLACIEDGDPVTLRVFFAVTRVLARRLAAMNRKFVELDQRAPGARFDELRDFQARLMSEWTM